MRLITRILVYSAGWMAGGASLLVTSIYVLEALLCVKPGLWGMIFWGLGGGERHSDYA